MKLNKFVFWLHLTTGAVAGIVVLIMSVTGLLLAFERQITTWADGGYRSGPPSPGMAALPVEALLAKILRSQPGDPSALTIRSDPSSAAEAAFGRERILFVNRYTGEILGEGSPRVRSLFRVILGIHRWLGAEGASRTAARAVTGASNLAFLFLVISGFYLWWPRKWTWRNFRMVTWFRGGISGRARDWNWHNVTGFWCAAPLLLIVLSGVVMSYSWANDLLFRIAGSERPKGVRDNAPPASWDLDGLDKLWARAERQIPAWRSIALKLPPGRSATFVIDQGNGGRPDKRAQLTLDRRTGAVVRWEPFAGFSPGQRLRAWLRWGHTGEAAGLIGQIVAAIASAGASLLVWTGLALGLRRFRAWRAPARSAQRFAA